MKMLENTTITYIVDDKEAFTTYCVNENDVKAIYLYDKEIEIRFEDGSFIVYIKNNILSYSSF